MDARISAVEELAVTQDAATHADHIIAEAQQHAKQLLREANAKVAALHAEWEQAFQQALRMGWTRQALSAAPLNLHRPSRPKTRRATPTATTKNRAARPRDNTTHDDTAGAAPPGPAGPLPDRMPMAPMPDAAPAAQQ
jgi:cell division septum initiation protein DivIVA